MHSFAVVLFASALVVTACHSEEPKSPDRGLTSPVAPPVMPVERGPATVEIEGPYSMYLTESISSRCTGPDPTFSLDVSQPTSADQPTMKNLVACMTSGALKGRSILLIGHTDPTGTAEHNEKLGLERAEKVKAYLVSNGIGADRVSTATAGADSASSAPKDWGKDRRVEVRLAP